MTTIDQRDALLRLGEHQLFTRSWTPSDPKADRLTPVLLFHDSLGAIELWRSFPEKLATATGRRVVAYDRLGFGRSDPHPGTLGLDFVADEAESVVPQLCDQLGLCDFIACGHSVGGCMAIETAARWPGRCQALVTIAAQTFIEDRTLAGIRVAQQDFQNPDNFARLARYHGDKTPWVLEAWIGTWLSPAFADWTLDRPLAAMRCPVLAIHGELDEYGSLRHPPRIAEGRGETLILPGVGHVPHREAEDVLVAAIAGFLAAI
ncbi:Pimeloyl-ACP methyl ester carboxylesterase [Bosea sp. 62]|uniref:alpha/beta fold hydrolase n=1 Tax=unclassified Bosea (in: a-proteobacteria) TaxID=2653178 RepID=UPI0012535439|nr:MULTISPECIES: alpha/beta hydrolase [unclassified Bosea (in: a-proteobacteria)]CAD5253979.1 Pimeloyl-ACP methyl ester carboxylesterase [Bosea sp. 7B]CAD5277209.1 Pimeloyl-ACP methyl ester carboxylesterase [Bosea sp. 21B]CAD5278309.1 Pimeloyl-ACP methyl ester carboxylesterase [Bosea sp. 46]VVT59794.1 Pimeloyl-ACP methyl ester carboxylesterase [Bosea sp. EC-HK365B]VXB43597.1 Pimeloyl-ACP methyl ester carboxylesterase [Bosea sp. 62]